MAGERGMTDLSEEAGLKRLMAAHLDACSACRECLGTQGRTSSCKQGHNISMAWLRMRATKNDPYAIQLLDMIDKNRQTAQRNE
jgi:hypothetical protein